MTKKWFAWMNQTRCLLHRQATLLFLVALFIVGMSLPIAAQQATVPQTATQTIQTESDAKALDQQGRQHYEAGQYVEAITVWQAAIATFKATDDRLGQAQTLSNLSLAYQQLGQWDKASAAITDSLTLGQTAMSSLLVNTIADLNSNPLITLRMGDSGTEGLIGDEDTPSTNFSRG